MRLFIKIFILSLFPVLLAIGFYHHGNAQDQSEGLPIQNPVDPAIQAGFVPHKATYDIRLTSTKSGSQVLNVGGKMTYEWTSNCSAWTTNHHFDLRYEYVNSSPLEVTSNFTTYELFDGKEFNFSTQRKRSGKLFEEIRGYAAMPPNETEGGQAIFSKPDDLTHDLPPGTVFPMKHTLLILKALQENKTFLNLPIFDGSDEDGALEINAFLGGETAAPAKLKNSDQIDYALLDNTAWNARLGFFPLNNKEETSDYEMSLVFHENGIISDMIVDYDDFSVTQKLVALEMGSSECKAEDN